jgi:membrane glycosyltransferase
MRRYGGAGRFFAAVTLETVFGMLMAPAVAFRLTLFMIGLAFGRQIGWGAQIRDAYDLGWRDAARALWPQTLFGLCLAAMLWQAAPEALPWAAPVLTGLAFAIPFAVLTTSQRLGRWMARNGVAAIPEEVDRPELLEAVRRVRLDRPPAPEGEDAHITPLVGRAA